MQAIGNDIVDLRQAALDSDWRRKGYLQKIFTEEEQLLIANAYAPDLIVWLLWSMKESAYKTGSKINQIDAFAPAKIKCTIESPDQTYHFIRPASLMVSGKAEFEGNTYYTQSLISIENYIHTIASQKKQDLENTKIEISLDDNRDYKATNPSSTSHHGRYLALIY